MDKNNKEIKCKLQKQSLTKAGPGLKTRKYVQAILLQLNIVLCTGAR
jgi:hypothetical protein